MENNNQLILSDDIYPELKINDKELQIYSWNLFSVLLSIGHPVTPIELSSRCSYFDAKPEFIEFVCSVKNSPISLTRDGFVTVSSAVCVLLQRFLSNSNRVFQVLIPSSRKRRRLWPSVSERADEMDLDIPFRIRNPFPQIYIHEDAVRSVIMKEENRSAGISNDNGSDEMTVRMPSLMKFDSGLLSYGLNDGKREGERDMSTIFSMNALGGKTRFLGNDTCISSSSRNAMMLGELQSHFQIQSLSNLNAVSYLRFEDIQCDGCLLSKTSCRVSCQSNDNNNVTSLVKDLMENGSSAVNNDSLEREIVEEGRELSEGNAVSLSNNTCHRVLESNIGNGNILSCKDMAHCFGSVENASCQAVGEHNIVLPADAENLCIDDAHIDDLPEEVKASCGREEQLASSQKVEQEPEKFPISMDVICKDGGTGNNSVRYKEISKNAELNLMSSTKELISFDQKHLPGSAANLDAVPKATNSTVQRVYITRNKGNDTGSLTEQNHCRNDKSAVTKQKLKPPCDQKMNTTRKQDNLRENKEKAHTISVKGHAQSKEVPMFESFIVEEEEGSGGYGTVYKAKRKNDGTTFAVKYPHVNANRHHVYNEVKMLERFGGKNFVIRYEGKFRSDNSHCLVLEHVVHDRPEVLKREIDVFQLRWYGYCLFRALASLHKQGVVHRDVKPGNFLFSRKASKGYLIDFNLATDLHQKFVSTEKSKSLHDASYGIVPPSHPESLPPSKSRKYTTAKALEAGMHTKSLLFPKNLKKKTDHMQSVMKSQGADGSGITSTKDATSSRVPSAERFRQPIPCKGRKELLDLAHEAMQSHDHGTSTLGLKRKRVAAPPAKFDNKFFYPTPMPLQCSGIAESGAGSLKYKGEGKQRKDGPCVGTKGFRAPEVLLRSTYQGPKVDVWSAGVTLLYLIVGRSPFVGDPDQNIKEIAKFRGSEDLWEVAKLHDRESSFPPELFQIQSLDSTKLKEWCKQITRRPEFLEDIPNSLLDLVDKCLMVNPRSRISSEDALRHEFFTPCYKEIEKQRLLRQRLSLESQNAQPATCEAPTLTT